MAGTTVRVPIAETTFSNRVFIHDYPRSSKIEAHFQSNERLYISYYNIISLGTYPSTPKLTQKSKNNASQYPIPDDYIVETEFSERSLICKTKYISVSKVCYTINWKIGHAEWSVSSTQSSTAVVNTFLQQNKRFNSFRRDVQKAVDELIVKHKLTNLSGEPILYLQHIGFDCKENQVCINFKDSNSMTIQTKLDAIVRVCDEALLSRDGYRHLAAVVPSLFQDIDQFNGDNNSDERASDTLVNNNEVGNGAYRSLSTLLKILIPVWKGRENPVIIPGDILHIKLGGDGRNVGRKQNHVMVTFCLLNEKDDVLKPNHQYRDVQKAVDELIVKHKLTNLSGEPILYLQHIGFDCKENQVCINFKDSNSMTIQTKLDAIVRVCDEALLSRDGYRHLAAVVPSLFQDIDQFNGDNNSDERASDTLVNNNEVGNGAYRSLSTLLKILIPVWKGRENPVIIPGDILHIKLGGDGRNVGRKQNHVMVTFCLLNEKDDVLKPNHQYSICLCIGKEKYETLDKVGKIFALQLADLKENRIIDDDDGVH
ncbi:hypothetical protein RhiirB3_447790 [Rhizophagus irregularis]|nr:hypothetical protein RhiirB3_447790 [Rhizophagus irregularis]